MSYFEIGIFHNKNEANIGTLWRSAYQLGASGIFTIGKRYKNQASDTMKVHTKVPLRHYKTFEDFLSNRPKGSMLVGIEMGGEPLKTFEHPSICIYLLGAEDYGLTPKALNQCQKIVSLDSINTDSYNVAVAGSIVMYDRMNKLLL